MPTLKQKLVLKNLPRANYSLSKAMRLSGYTKASSLAGSQYKSLQRFTSKIDYFNPEVIKKDIIAAYRLARRRKDITNMARMNEHRSKIARMVTDLVENKNPDKIIISYTGKKDDLPTESPPTNLIPESPTETPSTN